ncbi:MAG: sensor histidine kinase [Cyanobacteria bacterium J06598_1]
MSRRLHCTVIDNGQGLSPQQCNSLFERYARTRDARQPMHLGLGLYICHQIVTAHGGQIGVNSQIGAGACFWFTLPVATNARQASLFQH